MSRPRPESKLAGFDPGRGSPRIEPEASGSEATMGEGGRGGGGCLKGILIGCGVLLALGILVVVGITMNLDLIKESGWFRSIAKTAETAKVEVGRSMEIRAALLETYPSDQIGVHVGYHSADGVSVKTLAVSIEGPQFAIPEERAAYEELVRGIAFDVARLHPEIGLYDQIQVRVVRRLGVATVSTSADEFTFAVDELLGGATGVEPGAE